MYTFRIVVHNRCQMCQAGVEITSSSTPLPPNFLLLCNRSCWWQCHGNTLGSATSKTTVPSCGLQDCLLFNVLDDRNITTVCVLCAIFIQLLECCVLLEQGFYCKEVLATLQRKITSSKSIIENKYSNSNPLRRCLITIYQTTNVAFSNDKSVL